MSTIVTRSGKGSPLSHVEVDANFTNLNTDKIQSGNTVAALTITSATINGGSINGTTVGATTASTGNFTTLGATGVATFSAGTVSAPAITTTGDTNTGIFFPAADTIAFTEGGAESMRIDAGGNVGIGATPSAWTSALKAIQVLGASIFNNNNSTGFASNVFRTGGGYTPTYYSNGNAGEFGYNLDGTYAWSFHNAISGTAGTTATLTERMRIDSAGNVSVGTTTAAGKLTVTQATAGATAAVVNGVAAKLTFDYLGGGQSYIDGAQLNFRKVDSTACGYLSTQSNTILNLSSSTGYSVCTINSATGNATYLDFAVNSTAAGRITTDSNGVIAIYNGSSNTERMRIDASGNVGIGATSIAANTKLLVSGGRSNFVANSDAYAIGVGYASVGAYYIGANSANNALLFSDSGGSERMRIDSSGNLLVGTTSSSLGASGFVFSPQYNRVNSAGVSIQHANGTPGGDVYVGFIYNSTFIGSISQSGTTGVLYNLTSDARLKTNIVNCPLGNIDDVKVRSFDWKSDGSHVEYGFIAQELVEVAPYAVHQPQDPEAMMAVDYSKLVPMMIKEIQDLKQRIKTLENK